MIWHLIGVLIVGLCAGALAYFLRKITRQKIPKWLIPVAASLGMFGYLAYYDYTWYEFKIGQMPENSMVLKEYRESDFFKPWSYLYPAVNRFDLFDGAFSVREQEGSKIVEYIAYSFVKDPVERIDVQTHILHCKTRERVILEKVQPLAVQRVEVIDARDVVYQRAC